MTKASPPPAYDISFEQRPAYLFADVECHDPCLDVKKAYLIEIGQKCFELETSRLLIDRRVPDTLSNIESHLAIDAFANAAPTGLRVAIVDTNEINRQRLSFGVRTAEPKNITIHIFDDLKDAELWLAGDGQTGGQ